MVGVGDDAPDPVNPPPQAGEQLRLRLHGRVRILIPGDLRRRRTTNVARDEKEIKFRGKEGTRREHRTKARTALTTMVGTLTREGWHSFSWCRFHHCALMGSLTSAAAANSFADAGHSRAPSLTLVKSSMAPSYSFLAAISWSGKSSWSVWPFGGTSGASGGA